MLRSAIYTGQVFHKRYVPKEHVLSYGSFFMLLALEELPALEDISSLFAWNRRAWFSFHESDFGAELNSSNGDKNSSLKHGLESLLARHGFTGTDWHFDLLTMPRTLGYSFNPISLIYCRDNKNTVKAMIYEVSNTFGERIHYVLPVEPESDTETKQKRIRHRCDKELFVSPFFNMQGGYLFDISRPTERLDFKIDYLVKDELQLRASFSGIRHSFSATSLRALALKHSSTTYKVTLGIHWEAVKLWWKGLSLVNHVPLVVTEDELAATASPITKVPSGNTEIIYKPHTYGTKHPTTHPQSEKKS